MSRFGVSSRHLELIKELITQQLQITKGMDSMLRHGKVVSVEPGRVIFETEIMEEHCNRKNTMHGAFAALLVNSVTGIAIATQRESSFVESNPKLLQTGVSVNFSLNFLRAAKLGEKIVADAVVQKIGKTMAFASCDIRDKEKGNLLVTGQHVKFLA